jgi:hypothetical protein
VFLYAQRFTKDLKKNVTFKTEDERSYQLY